MSDNPHTCALTDEQIEHWPLNALTELHLELGKQCNVRCAMCYQTDFSPATRMSDAIWRERLLPAYQTARQLILSGGEPTVLSNCRQLVELVMRDYPHLKLHTVTNGIRFDGFWAEAFLQHGAYVNFSLNAVDPERYQRIVQFGRQELVIRNIDQLVSRKAATNSPLVIRISTVILDDTVDEMPAFVQWAADHGLDQVLLFTDHFGSLKRTSVATVRQRIAEAYAVADRNPQIKVICLDDFDWYFAQLHHLPPVRPRQTSVTERKPCPTAFNTLFVNPDGTARPCCKSWYYFGNLNRQSLEDVWNSRLAQRFRRRMLNFDFRDCLVACDLNVQPIHPRVATARKAFWIVRRDPGSALKKAARKFGLTSAQIKPPED